MTVVRFQAQSTLILAARRIFLSFCCVLALTGALARETHAGLIGEFQDFSLTNSTFANGHAETFDGGLSLLFTGPNDGSGVPGTTDLTMVSRAAECSISTTSIPPWTRLVLPSPSTC